jgi:hypothetical protein
MLKQMDIMSVLAMNGKELPQACINGVRPPRSELEPAKAHVTCVTTAQLACLVELNVKGFITPDLSTFTADTRSQWLIDRASGMQQSPNFRNQVHRQISVQSSFQANTMLRDA